MQRTIQLGEEVDADNISASIENGMLPIVVARVRAPEPKKITVSSSEQGAQQLRAGVSTCVAKGPATSQVIPAAGVAYARAAVLLGCALEGSQ